MTLAGAGEESSVESASELVDVLLCDRYAKRVSPVDSMIDLFTQSVDLDAGDKNTKRFVVARAS